MRRAAAVLAAAVFVSAPPAIAGAADTLPSGRTEYRALADYSAEIAALAAAHPDRVRRVVIGASVAGRPVEGLEIAADVARTDDGRPVHLELGLTHGNEWPSGEVVMELAHELAAGTGSRLQRLRARTRTFLFPVLNPDGLQLSQTVFDAQRKNAAGVDLNRNFGTFWGGPGAGDDLQSSTYRGPEPYSEPESAALRAFSSAHHVVVVNSNHTFGSAVLHQPGFGVDAPGLPAGTRLPGTGRFAALGARMARAAGYDSAPAFTLGDITGAVEDFNYFNQFALAFTTEIGEDAHHGPYADAVVDQYAAGSDGTGVRAAMLLAGEAAAGRSSHALLRGSAPPGETLRLTRTVASPTFTRSLTERFATSLTVGPTGRFRWHVNPSTRPLAVLAGRTEKWTLTCGDQRRRFAVGLGRVRNLALTC